MSDSNAVSIAYATESTFGSAPTSGYGLFRYTGESLEHSKTMNNSQEIRSDGNIPDITEMSSENTGSLDFELSYEALDTFLEGVLLGSWSSNVLKNGRAIKSFSIEKHFGGSGISKPYHLFKGMSANTLNLTLPAGGFVTGSVGFTGTSVEANTARKQSAAYSAAPTNRVMTGVSNVTSISDAGSAVARIMNATLSVTNNLRTRPVLGSTVTESMGYGYVEVTGTISAYFQTGGLYDKFIGQNDSSLSFVLSDTAGNAYTILLPKVKYVSGTITAGGVNSDVMSDIGFSAFYDSTQASSISITRADS